MKTIRIVVSAVIALCALQTFADHTEVTQVPRLPFLRGVGFDGYYGGRDRSYMKQASVYSQIAAKGFDHVRLPVDFRDYSAFDASTGVATLKETTTPGWTNFGWTTGVGFSTFDAIITNAINAGLYIALDFHGWFDVNPSDATQTNQFISLWKAVAERYKDYPNQLIFEIANEPQNRNWTGICTMQRNAIKEIRKTNPTRLILFDQVDGSQAWVFPEGWPKLPASDNNLAVAIHCYNPYDFTSQGGWGSTNQTTTIRLDDAHRATINWDLRQCHNWMEKTGVPIVINEFGVSHKAGVADRGDITEFYSIITRWCEAHNVPWAPWSYYGNETLDVTDGNGNMYDFVEAGLFPDLKVTDKFNASDYPHKIEITFSGYAGSSTLANFPVLVKLSESLTGFRYSDFTRADGYDLCFTDASGNLIPHEIDTWNPSGVSTVWVKVPSLTSSTKIVARYGCAKPIVHKVESVWDSNYVAVWHMGEPKLPLADSSNASRDLTASDGSGLGYGVAGVTGGAVDFGAAGGSRGLFADDHMNLDGHAKLTVEAWTYQKAHGTNAGIVSKRKASGNQASYYLYDNGSTTTFQVSSNGTAAVASGVNLSPVAGRWNHQAYTIDTTASANNAAGYLDGTRVGTATAAVKGPVFAGTGELCIGNLQSGNAANFPGRIDEVRISKCVRSADWVKASYDTVANAAFATYAVDGVVSTSAPEEQGANLVPDDVIEYSALDMDAFAKKVTVTFSGYSGSALTDFPVLVKLSTAIDGFSYSDFQKANGGDLRFADADGTLLAHEIDTWNSNGVSTVWVKVPTLTANGTITACYGCVNPPAVDSKEVWDDNYLGVWHLGAENGSTLEADSTANGKDFSVNTNYSDGVAVGANGVVGRSVASGLRSDGKGCLSQSDTDYMFSQFGAFTMEVWAYQDDHDIGGQTDSRRYIMSHSSNNATDWQIYEAKSGKHCLRIHNLKSEECAVYAANDAVKPARAAWNHTAFSWNGSSGAVGLYLNGSSLQLHSDVGEASAWVGQMTHSQVTGFSLGNYRYENSSGNMPFKGLIDEVRISKVARSADWIKATHDTIANADFATYTVTGAEPPVVFAKEVGVAFAGYTGAALADFPVLVRLSPNIAGFSYADFNLANGGDLRFFDESGNLLAHEIDTWNPSGVSTVWVKVPSLTATTKIMAKYGSTATLPAVNAKDVWDDDYVGVWHLGESALPMKESSETSSDFTSSYGTTIGYAADGVVGRAVDFPAGGLTNALVAADHDALDGFSQFTVETWTFQAAHKASAGILSKRKEYNKECAYYVYDDGSKVAFCVGTNRSAAARWCFNQYPVLGEWTYLVHTVDMMSTSKNIHGLKNGVMNGWENGLDLFGPMENTASDLYLGNLGAKKSANSFNGRIDEVRISKVVRSAAWIKATYETVMKPDFARYEVQDAAALAGYAAWMNANELFGTPDEKSANGIENGVRYAFDIDPATSEIGTPIIEVVRDANGNPSVRSRDLATGRDDVTFGILATPDLMDWSNAVLVPMTKFATDGLWKPTASESAGYVFPSQMFFKYKIDIKE